MTQDTLSFSTIPDDLGKRIYAAKASKSLSVCAGSILDVLSDGNLPHVGKDSAISIAELKDYFMNMWGRAWTDREIKAGVEELRSEYRIPVGANRQKPYGYYLATTDAELQSTAEVYVSQAISMLKHAQVFSPKSDYVRHRLGQLELE